MVRWAIRIFAVLTLTFLVLSVWLGLQFFLTKSSASALQSGEMAVMFLLAVPGLTLVMWSLGEIDRSLRELVKQRSNLPNEPPSP